jgi:hypothetical protein
MPVADFDVPADALYCVQDVGEAFGIRSHSAAASASTRSLIRAFKPCGVATSTCRPTISSTSRAKPLNSKSVVRGPGATSKSTSLVSPASSRATEPKTRTSSRPRRDAASSIFPRLSGESAAAHPSGPSPARPADFVDETTKLGSRPVSAGAGRLPSSSRCILARVGRVVPGHGGHGPRALRRQRRLSPPGHPAEHHRRGQALGHASRARAG